MRQAQQEYATREAAIRQEAERYRQQVMALTGVTPPPNPEVDAVRQQFGQLFPGLSKLETLADQIAALTSRSGDLEAQSQHYWQQYGNQTMSRLFERAAESLGSPLTEDAQRLLHSAFVGFVQSSPENSARYASDPSIVEDFWKAYTSSFIDPVRRVASAAVAGRAGATPLPQDTPGGAPRGTPVPKLTSLDERAAAGWAQMNMPKA
jgi:hypothetical protein